MADDAVAAPSDLISLDGKIAVVTGAARGIGRSVASVLLAAGAEVWLVDVDREAALEAVEELRVGAPAHAAVADVRDPTALERVAAEVVASSGSLDIVVANAGRMTTAGLDSITVEEWEDGITTNLTGSFFTARAVAPALRASGDGRLILMSSGAAFDPRTVTGLAYAVAKAGISHLAGLLAVQFAGTGVTVNAVAPGPVATDMSAVFPTEALHRYVENSPLRRMGTVDDVARVVLFLASELGSFVNGQVIRVAGGP